MRSSKLNRIKKFLRFCLRKVQFKLKKNTICDFFQTKFFVKTYKINFENYNHELQNFRQIKNMFLLNNYNKIKVLIYKINVKKRSSFFPLFIKCIQSKRL